jgi:hypothetical protein
MSPIVRAPGFARVPAGTEHAAPAQIRGWRALCADCGHMELEPLSYYGARAKMKAHRKVCTKKAARR